MSIEGTMALQYMEEVDLIDNLMDVNPLSDLVDPSAAYVIESTIAQKAGILPFGWDHGVLCIASAGPLVSWAQSHLEQLGPYRLYHAHPLDIALAQKHLYGDRSNEPPKRFGELAIQAKRLNRAQLDKALGQQEVSGGKLGEICVALNFLTAWDVTQVLSQQTGLPAVNLLKQASDYLFDTEVNKVWGLLDEG